MTQPFIFFLVPSTCRQNGPSTLQANFYSSPGFGAWSKFPAQIQRIFLSFFLSLFSFDLPNELPNERKRVKSRVLTCENTLTSFDSSIQCLNLSLLQATASRSAQNVAYRVTRRLEISHSLWKCSINIFSNKHIFGVAKELISEEKSYIKLFPNSRNFVFHAFVEILNRFAL